MVEINSEEIGKIVDGVIDQAKASPDLLRNRVSIDFRKIIPLLNPVICQYAPQAAQGQKVKIEVMDIARKHLVESGYSHNGTGNDLHHYFKSLQE